MSGGEKLKRLRVRNCLTQDQLASASGVAQSQISEIESGKHQMMPETAKKLAGPVGVHWTFFYADEERTVDNAS